MTSGTRRGWGVSVTPRPLFIPRKDPVPIVQEAGWAPGPVWIGAENLGPTGIRFSDLPARSQSLYRQRYLAHCLLKCNVIQKDEHRQPVCSKWWFQRQMFSLVGGWMSKRRRNARCTAVADSVLMDSRTQKILCCIVAFLLSTEAAARLCDRRAL